MYLAKSCQKELRCRPKSGSWYLLILISILNILRVEIRNNMLWKNGSTWFNMMFISDNISCPTNSITNKGVKIIQLLGSFLGHNPVFRVCCRVSCRNHVVYSSGFFHGFSYSCIPLSISSYGFVGLTNNWLRKSSTFSKLTNYDHE